LVDVISTIEKYDDSTLLDEIKSIFSNIENLNEKVDNFKPLDIKIDNNNKLLE
jgi:hypothetical protein